MQIERQNFVNNAIDKMFNLAGHNVSHQDFKRKNIYAHNKYPILDYQQEEFQNWFLNNVKKTTFVTTDLEAENEFSWFINQYGLQIKKQDNLIPETSNF